MNKKEILFCLPTYNEELSVENLIDRVQNMGMDLIITDGGSTDSTIQIAKSKEVHIIHRPGKEKGYGFMLALNYAQQNGYKYLAVADCDSTYPVEEMSDYKDYIKNNDIIIYCRKFNDIAWHRRLINYILKFVFNKIFETNFKDLITGMRILKVDQFAGLVSLNELFVEVEINLIIIKNNLKYLEKDIRYYKRVGKHKSQFTDFFKILAYIFKNYPLK